MLCNNYAPELEEQPGEQPIRVFYRYYNNIFLNIRNELSAKYFLSNLSRISFYFKTELCEAKSPYCSSFSIQIQDTFLSFLWNYCYGLLIKTPSGGKELTDIERKEADELFKYALHLLREYKEWDKQSLPNPELHGKDEKQLIGKSNMSFLIAINFIIYHEFAHIVLGHIDEINKCHYESRVLSFERSINMEKEADRFAIDKIIESDQFDEYSYVGVLSALCALTFTSPKFSGGKDHPDPDRRIIDFLERLNHEEDHPFWGMASWALMEWQINFKSIFGFPSEFKNQKQYFYDLIALLEQFKKI